MTSSEPLGVLVTRPAHQAQSLCEALLTQGKQPFRLPAISIETSAMADTTQHYLDALETVDLIIIVSANVCYTLGKALQAAYTGCKRSPVVAAIGPGTAKAITTLGLPVTIIPDTDYSSEGLLAHPALQAVQAQQILLLCGEEPRTTLQDTLTARGAHVTVGYCYQRCKPKYSPEELQRTVPLCQVVVITSSTALRNLAELQYPPLMTLTLVLIHPKQLSLANSLGFTGNILLAENATDEAILKTLSSMT